MFGDLFGDMEAKQKALRAKLAEIEVEAEAGGNAVRVVANANREIVNLKIDEDLLASQDGEQIEDLLMVAINRALSKAAEREATESQALLRDMLPPGLQGMGDLFG